MKMNEFKVVNYSSENENHLRQHLLTLFQQNPIPDTEKLGNLGLFLSSKTLSRILFMDFLYRQIVEKQGVIMEFGCRWGQNLALFSTLRCIYEPFNRHRKIIGFDSFQGFPKVSKADGQSAMMASGAVSVTANYDKYLQEVLGCHDQDSPLGHINKYELRKGDAIKEIDRYLAANPETIVALAYFDFDLYEPTKHCLQAVRPRLVKGSVLAFDELNDHDSPGESRALMEVMGLNNLRLNRYRYASRVSYFILE